MFCGYKDVSVYSKCDYFTICPYIFKFIMFSFQGVRNGSSKVSFHSEAVGERAQKPENERGPWISMGRCHTPSLRSKLGPVSRAHFGTSTLKGTGGQFQSLLCPWLTADRTHSISLVVPVEIWMRPFRRGVEYT